jgi:ion channel-forming bestrophin family protein
MISSATKSLKRKWWYTLFSKPHVYLKHLVLNTVYMGILVTLIFIAFEKYSTAHQQTIPVGFHSVIGIVLGLLLVFRTNTAYDRWWKAREVFAKLESLYIYYAQRAKAKWPTDLWKKEDVVEVGKELNMSLDLLVKFLTNRLDYSLKRHFNNIFYKREVAEGLQNVGVSSLHKEILDCFTSLERIRDTPIPLSYSLHIKVSVYLYFLTLPFGIFYEMGFWSIPLVMILYYIVAGIEIISNEIENPFHGDPNDLPVQKYINNLKQEIENITASE